MSSIPYDPTLNLGQIVGMQKIKDLMEIAKAQQPLEDCLDRMNNLLLTSYKMKMILGEMSSMGVSKPQLEEFIAEIDAVKEEVSASCMEYGRTALSVFKQVQKLKDAQGQKKISFSIESPIDYSLSKIVQFPLAFDALHFDVEYIRNEENEESSYSHAATVAKSTQKSSKILVYSHNKKTSESVTNTVNNQTTNHSIEGSIVITANANHRNADLIAPLVMDPLKAVSAWNYTFPDDILQVDATSLFKLALDDKKKKEKPKKDKKGNEIKNNLSIITGCSKASSFVGMVHLLKNERTDSTQTASSFASAVTNSVECDLWLVSAGGGYGTSKSFGSTAGHLLSNSNIENHATLDCVGIIPNISENDITATVMSMNPSPQEAMKQLAAISEASDSGVNKSMEDSGGKEAKTGDQFMSLKSDYMENTVSSLSAKESTNNKIIDCNSMMTAFTDFCNKAMEGKGCGVPEVFYMKHLTKVDIAKLYIRKFYKNGIAKPKDAIDGQLGETSKDDDSKGNDSKGNDSDSDEDK